MQIVAPDVRTRVVNIPCVRANPYQELLYRHAAPRYGLAAGDKAMLADPEGPLARGEARLLHLHWDDRIFGRGDDVAANRRHARRVLDTLAAFRRAGGGILWTIHNRRAHHEIDGATFHEARAALCDLAHVIHVHAPHAAAHMVETYGADPARIRVIAHPSYLGAYEPAAVTLSRPMPAGGPRDFLFFGTFRKEKGADALLGAARIMTRHGAAYRLRMIGRAFGGSRRLLRRFGDNPDVETRTDRVPDAEIPGIFAAAHAFPAPYSSLFTSGSAMLAQTYGLPVIGPDIRELRETVPEANHALLYDPAAPRGLVRMMKRVAAMPEAVLQRHRDACFAFARARAPEAIGPRVAAALDEIAERAG